MKSMQLILLACICFCLSSIIATADQAETPVQEQQYFNAVACLAKKAPALHSRNEWVFSLPLDQDCSENLLRDTFIDQQDKHTPDWVSGCDRMLFAANTWTVLQNAENAALNYREYVKLCPLRNNAFLNLFRLHLDDGGNLPSDALILLQLWENKEKVMPPYDNGRQESESNRLMLAWFAYQKLDKYKEAEALFKDYETGPLFITAHLILAKIYSVLGEETNMKENLSKAYQDAQTYTRKINDGTDYLEKARLYWNYLKNNQEPQLLLPPANSQFYLPEPPSVASSQLP